MKNSTRTYATSIALSFVVSACGSGLAHTVPDGAVERVTGQDKIQLAAEESALQQAKGAIGAVEDEKSRADGAIKEAKNEVVDARNELDELENRRNEIKEKIELAKEKVEWRQQQRALADLKAKKVDADVLAARAKYELAKFRIVGRVEMGGEEAFQTRLKDFESQLASLQAEAADMGNKVASQESDVASAGSRF